MIAEGMATLKRPYHNRCGMCALLAVVTLSAMSSTAEAQSFTEALAQAYLTNHNLLAERAGLRGTQEQIKQARAARLPQVSFSAQAGHSITWSDRSIDSLITGSNSSRTNASPISASLSAQQAIYQGGRIGNQIKQAKASVAASGAQLESSEQQLLSQAATVYMDVVRDLENVEIRLANITVLERQMEAAEARFDVGDISKTDVAQVAAQLAQAKAALAAAKAQLVASEAAFYALIGLRPAGLNRTPSLPRLPETIEQVIQLTLAQHPANLAAQKGEDAARYGVNIAKGVFRPTIGVQTSASLSRSGQFSGQESESVSVTGSFSVPIFTGGLNKSSLRQAKEGEVQARQARLATEKQTVQQAITAWHSYKAAITKLAASREQASAADIAFEGAQEEEKVGLRTILDVLIAEQTLRDALLAQNTARRDVIVGAIGVLASMGKFDLETFGIAAENGVPIVDIGADLFNPLVTTGAYIAHKGSYEYERLRKEHQAGDYYRQHRMSDPNLPSAYRRIFNPQSGGAPQVTYPVPQPMPSLPPGSAQLGSGSPPQQTAPIQFRRSTAYPQQNQNMEAVPGNQARGRR